MNSSRGGTIDEFEVRAIISINFKVKFPALTWEDGSSRETNGEVTDGENVDDGGLASGRKASCQICAQLM